MPETPPAPPPDWDAVADLFARATDADPAARPALLAGAAPDVRREAEALLGLDAPATAFFRGGARVLVDAEAGPDTLAPGARVGPWTVGPEIGRGGMGTVYRAERADGRYEQAVALKAVRRGMDTADVLARFRAERQILARLDHPAIARVVDGGETPDGRPYLCMDLVAGAPITGHADAARLTVEQRLALFADACDAVAYAHRRLVVHRDLKPSNILVTPEGGPDGGPCVKLLDFGIARVLSGDGDDLTATGPRQLTPAYAAPEQLRGEAVTTAADVYALGVVLHELLAGARPAGPDARASRSVAPAAAAARQTTAPRLARALRGDLDAVVARALRAEPEARYASASALAADVRRVLERQPVAARRGTRRYRAARFVRRHRASVAASVLGVAALAAFAGVSVVQQRRAEAESARAEATLAFMQGLFDATNASTGEPTALTALQMLDAARPRVDAEFAGDPAGRARLLVSVGDAYATLTQYGKAEPVLRDALDALDAAGRSGSPEAARALSSLALIETQAGRFDRAMAMQARAIAVLDRLNGAGAIESAHVRADAARTLHEAGRDAESEAAFRTAIADIARQPPGRARDLEGARAQFGLAFVLAQTGRPAEAERLQRAVLATRERLLGPDHYLVAVTLNNLANLLAEYERYDEALPLIERSLRLRRATTGDSSVAVVTGLANLAEAQRGLGRTAEAVATARQSLGLARALTGPDSPDSAYGLYVLANAERAHGDARQAEADYRAALRLHLALWGPDHLYTAYVTNNLGELLGETRRPAEALRLAREAVRARAALPDGDRLKARSAALLARLQPSPNPAAAAAAAARE